MSQYDVVVSNIGTVYSGARKDAEAAFNRYVALSRETLGARVSGETVSLFRDGELLCESDGALYLEK